MESNVCQNMRAKIQTKYYEVEVETNKQTNKQRSRN